MKDRQQDHHCIIFTDGYVWRISRARPPFIGLVCPKGCCKAAIDTTDFDFESYCTAAVMGDYANAAVVTSKARN